MPKDLPITELQYFENHNDKLKHIYCPHCLSKGGLFMGFKFIGCKNCCTYPDMLNEVNENVESNNDRIE